MLRKYQQEAVDTLWEYWGKGKTKPCILQLSTGSGKSHIISEIVKRINMPVLVLQPSKEILEQNYEKLVLAGVSKNKLNICSASAGGWEIGYITLATIGTIYKYPNFCKDFGAIVVDECVDANHEVLTPSGWMNIVDACENNSLIAQWEGGEITFVQPSRWVRKHTSSKKVKFTIRGEGAKQEIEIFMTQNHRQLVEKQHYGMNITTEVVSAKDVTLGSSWLKVASDVSDVTERASCWDRLKVAIAADGHTELRSGGKYWNRFAFRRERKIRQARKLLDECGIEYKKSVNVRGDTSITFHTNFPKGLTQICLDELSASQARDLCYELLLWDGCEKQMNFDTPLKEEADFAQALAVLGGYQTSIKLQSQTARSDIWRVHFINRKTKKLNNHKSCRGHGTSKELVDYDGEMLCPTVPSSFFVVRKNGFVYITGNCDVVNSDNVDGQYLKFFNKLPITIPIVGLTATPWRNQSFRDKNGQPAVYCRPLTRICTTKGDGTPHGKWFWTGGIIYKCEIPFLQQNGYLSPTEYYQAETDWSFVNEYPSRVDYDTQEMTQWMDFDSNMSRFHQAIKWCMDNKLKTIVFTPNIDMNFRLAGCISSAGGSVQCMDSLNDSHDSRQRKMDNFRAGNFQFLVNVGMVGRGVDVPSVDCVLLCRPTKSLSLYMQYVGRCLRLDPDNPDKIARVVDLSGNVARFGKVEDVALGKQSRPGTYGNFETDIITVGIGGKRYKWEKVG